MARKRLGELLIEAGAITAEQLQRALKEQKEWGGPLGQVLLDLNYIDEEGLVKALSTQLNIPIANLDGLRIPPMVLEMVPPEFCRDHALLPFNYEPVGAFLDVAMVEPVDLDTLDKIRVLTQCNVRPHFTTYGALARGLYRYHGFRTNLKPPKGRARGPSRTENVILDAREKVLEDDEEPVPETLTLRPVSEKDIAALSANNPAPNPKPAANRKKQAAHAASRNVKSPDQQAKEVARLEALLTANYHRLMEAEQRLNDLHTLLQRDERILRRILGLLVDKGLITSEDLQRVLDI